MIVRVALAMLFLLLLAGCGAARPATPTPGTAPTAGVVGNPDPCSLITAAELTAILGESMAEDGSDSLICRWTASGEALSLISIGFEAGNLSDAKAGLANPADITVGGLPAVVGALFMEGDILYVARDNIRLWVNLPYVPRDTPEVRQQLIQIAETAVSRWR